MVILIRKKYSRGFDLKEQTFIIIKPDAIDRMLEKEIFNIIEENGFSILESKKVIVKKDIILKHYQEVIERIQLDYFQNAIIEAFNQKEVIIAKIESETDTINKLRKLVGATDPSKASSDSIRGKLGNDSFDLASKEKRMINNLIHASDSIISAKKEISLWFDKQSF